MGFFGCWLDNVVHECPNIEKRVQWKYISPKNAKSLI